jgi:hypothetical protein
MLQSANNTQASMQSYGQRLVYQSEMLKMSHLSRVSYDLPPNGIKVKDT